MPMTTLSPGPISGLVAALALLGACADQSVPTTYAAMSSGVGFGDYQQHLRAREAAQRSGVPYSIPPEGAASASAADPSEPLPLPAAAHAEPSSGQIGTSPLAIPAATGSDRESGAEQSMETAAFPAEAERPEEVSDTVAAQSETTFGTPPASARQAEIVNVGEVAIGQSSGPNVMAYALNTRHSVGTEMYTRRNPLRWSRWERNCLQYASQDQAQEAFLEAGGPERDPMHLDPDGDGFACWWDPEPLRRLARIAPTQQGAADE